MKGIREIKRRIKSVKSTAQITRAMQLVAASKMKRAQEHTLANRPYALLLHTMLAQLQGRMSDFEHPLMTPRPVTKRGVLVISTARGLCGPLNSNLNRILSSLPENTQFVCAGHKGLQFLARLQRPILADFAVPEVVTFQSIRPIADYLISRFLEGTIDTIEIAYPTYINTLIQQPIITPLAPIIDLETSLNDLRAAYRIPAPTTKADERYFTFEPSPNAILSILPELFIKHAIHHSFLEARAAEHSARMVAMKTATDNAKSLAQDLTLEYNKARQAAITQEILEIAAATLSKAL